MSALSLDRRSLFGMLAGLSAAVVTSHVSSQEKSSERILPLGDGPIPADANLQLQAIGSLGVGHIQSTLGMIGAIADTLSKNVYTEKQIEDLMIGTYNGLELPKKILRRLQDSNISPDDSEFLDRMIGVLNALQREANALKVFAKSRKPDDAALYERARKLAVRKLGDLTHRDELFQSEAIPPRISIPKTGNGDETN